VYLGFAHACLFVALAVIAVWPSELGGFYYHPRLIAVVHLVTLGFVTSAVLGALYLVAPLALRLPLAERRADLVAAVSWMVGVSGIASHFWLESYTGMSWSGGMALLTPLWVGGRVLLGLRRAPVPLGSRLPVALAILNLYAAGGLGVLLGLNKHEPFLPFAQLDAVHAHLHLGAVGFATLMVVGVGYRMLPMVLPAAMPRGPLPLASALVIEGGVLGLAAALVLARPLVSSFALLTIAGVGLFLSQLLFMLRNRRPAPAARPRPDWPMGHVLQAVAYLVIGAALGLYLAFAEPSEASLRLAFAYGVCGLLGFLAQLVVGVEVRLVPLAAWIRSYADAGYRTLPESVQGWPPGSIGRASVVLWSLGVPCLTAGLALDSPASTSIGAAGLAGAVALVSASGGRALRRLRRRAPAQQDAL
jgi:hypothetical protein